MAGNSLVQFVSCDVGLAHGASVGVTVVGKTGLHIGVNQGSNFYLTNDTDSSIKGCFILQNGSIKTFTCNANSDTTINLGLSGNFAYLMFYSAP